MLRLYLASMALIAGGALSLGLLWWSVDQVLGEGAYLWTYLAMALGVATLVVMGFLGVIFGRFESKHRESHRQQGR